MPDTSTRRPPVSIVIPVLNEAATIKATLANLRRNAPAAELIVVDGGSRDATLSEAEAADQIINSAPGRARQMNTGAAQACADWLLFVHADTRVPPPVLAEISTAERRGREWGFFRLNLGDPHWALRMVGAFASARSRLSRVATGDQCLFLKRRLFEAVGGFADVPLMEDIELSKRLRQRGAPYVSACAAVSSSRRWRAHGILRTILLMWWLRLRYFAGVSPERLHKAYYQ